MLWIPAFAGMTKEIDGLDESSPYFLSSSFFTRYAIL
jgi:hypothetical protein